jgi:hypothetical protein
VTAPDEEDHSAEAADVSKQLANPIANMVSIPFQFNWYVHIAPFDSTGFVFNLQPVVPFTLNNDWNLIMRFILPFAGVPALTENGIPQSGTSDITLSLFFSPAHSKWIWGIGPAFGIPTSSDPQLTSGMPYRSRSPAKGRTTGKRSQDSRRPCRFKPISRRSRSWGRFRSRSYVVAGISSRDQTALNTGWRA